MKNKSLLFQTVTVEEINAVMQKHFSSVVKEYKLLNGGMFNTTYSVQLENRKLVILRIGPVREDVLLPFELHLAEAELYSCELLKNTGISSNCPIVSDFSKEIIPRKYIIFEYIQGVTLFDKSVK